MASSLRTGTQRWFMPYVLAAGCAAAAAAFRLLLDPVLQGEQVFLYFLPAVFVSAYFWGARAGLLATSVSAFAAATLLLEPRYSVLVSDRIRMLQLGAFVAVSVAASVLGGALRRSHAVARLAGRLRALQEVTAALSASDTPEKVAQALFDLAARTLGARGGLIWDLKGPDEARLELLASFGYSDDAVVAWRGAPTGLPGPVVETLRTRKPLWLRTSADIDAHDPHRHVRVRKEDQSWAVVPLENQTREIGILALGFPRPKPFDVEERGFIVAAAQQCALALERARLYETAREASRSKDEFLALVSHELRTPMSAILGWVDLLRTGRLDSDTSRRALDVIGRNTQAQSRLITDLLDMARILSRKLTLETTRVDLQTSLREAVETVRPAAQDKGIHLEERPAPEKLFLEADPARLQQVASNLLSNAVKFTPPGGHVTLSLSREGDQAVIVVADTGRGIEPEFLPRLFDRFAQEDAMATRRHGGLGLGLTIVKHLVEAHHGTVAARSGGPRQGATFTVRLPLAPAPQAVPPTRAGNTATGSGLDSLRVLVVEDNHDVAELVRLVLEQSGATVAVAHSAAEALRTVPAVAPHILVCDIGLPDEDGYELLAKVRALPTKARDTPAVALTAHAREQDRARAAAAGFQEYLSKPVLPGDLTAAVARAARPRRDSSYGGT